MPIKQKFTDHEVARMEALISRIIRESVPQSVISTSAEMIREILQGTTSEYKKEK